MKNVIVVILVACIIFLDNQLAAQETLPDRNPNSVYPIHRDDIMFTKKVWRRMDLEEKINHPFKARGYEMTKVIIEAAKRGQIAVFEDEDFEKRLTVEEFEKNLLIPGADMGDDLDDFGGGGFDDFGSGDDPWGDGGNDDDFDTGPTEFLAADITLIDIVEEMQFDKKRSRVYWDIQSLGLFVPQEKNDALQFNKVIGYFKFTELFDLFKSMPKEAIWFNPQNTREHKNLADAFNLRLFSARVTKVENPLDEGVIDIYDKGLKDAARGSLLIEEQLMEYEHELWEY
ncbi:MAG: gliding motility protein GldN [Cyclobacteriaceae bacterium]|nr:gliding motility protein GldN [Cyclobacteriaceae bacterium]MCH8515040.1 gliding motility protein GldN [Cyclobacteriaceae bacterium]